MIRKLTLAVGFGAGYVLGAKAGTQRYDEIMQKVNELMGKPAVQDFTQSVSSSASAAADKAKSTVNDKVSSASGSSSSSDALPADEIVVDLGTAPSSASVGSLGGGTTGAPLGSSTSSLGGTTGGSGPRPGATPSSTAPDVL